MGRGRFRPITDDICGRWTSSCATNDCVAHRDTGTGRWRDYDVEMGLERQLKMLSSPWGRKTAGGWSNRLEPLKSALHYGFASLTMTSFRHNAQRPVWNDGKLADRYAIKGDGIPLGRGRLQRRYTTTVLGVRRQNFFSPYIGAFAATIIYAKGLARSEEVLSF